MCAAALRRHYSHSLQLTFSIQSRLHVSHNTKVSAGNKITANGGHLQSSLNEGICFSWTQNQLGLTSASQSTASVVKNICVGNKMANKPFILTCAMRANGSYFSLWNELAPPFSTLFEPMNEVGGLFRRKLDQWLRQTVFDQIRLANPMSNVVCFNCND